MAKTADITLIEGDTTTYTVRWESPDFGYAAITAIAQSAPVSITAVAHGLTDGWRAAVVSVKGMTEINATTNALRDRDFHPVTVVNANSVKINAINAADFRAYTSGGYLQFYVPMSLAAYTAELTISTRPNGTVLDTLKSVDNEIKIDDTAKTIVVTFPAPTYKRASYNLDMIDVLGKHTTILSGTINVTQE